MTDTKEAKKLVEGFRDLTSKEDIALRTCREGGMDVGDVLLTVAQCDVEVYEGLVELGLLEGRESAAKGYRHYELTIAGREKLKSAPEPEKPTCYVDHVDGSDSGLCCECGGEGVAALVLPGRPYVSARCVCLSCVDKALSEHHRRSGGLPEGWAWGGLSGRPAAVHKASSTLVYPVVGPNGEYRGIQIQGDCAPKAVIDMVHAVHVARGV